MRLTAQWIALLALALAGCAGGGQTGGPSASAVAASGRVQPPGGSRAFAPYVDVTLSAPFDLGGVAFDAGARALTLAFVTGGVSGCAPTWGAQTAIDAPAVSAPAARLRAAGVGLRVSFGGAHGVELAQSCTSVSGLEVAYASVLDSFHAVAADFDLEGAALMDAAAMARRARAVAELQTRFGRRIAISLTLPVEPSGLSSAGLAAVWSFARAGVRVRTVNLLAMDYGTVALRGLPGTQTPVAAGASVDGSMARAAIRAARAAHRQLRSMGGELSSWSALGVTVMVGSNDVSGEVLTLADAQAVARFARAQGMGLVGIWSLARDNPCAGSESAAQATCSGVNEPPYAFSRVFGAQSRTGVRARRAVDTG